MKRIGLIGTLMAVSLIGWGAGPAPADDAVRLSGTITTVAPQGRAITVDVLGPWHGPNTAASRQEIAVPDRIPVTLFERSDVAPAGWRGGFAEKALSPADLRPGDYATVRAHRVDGRLIADDVGVVRPVE